MKFPYFKFRDGTSRPVIEMEVVYNKKSLRYFALIDSGADMNIFHAEVANTLGIDVESGIKMKAAGITEGESQACYVHPITLSIGGWKYETTAAFMTTLSKQGHGLLGQRDFFNLFKKISFDFNAKEIELAQKPAA